MAFKAFRDNADTGITLPINGKKYTIPPISARVGAEMLDYFTIAGKVAAAQQAGTEPSLAAEDMEILSDADERRMYKDALGPVWDQLTEDGCTFATLKLAAMTNIIHYVRDPETAEAYFNAGGKAPAPNRAARRTATRTRTGAATTTKRPA